MNADIKTIEMRESNVVINATLKIGTFVASHQ